MVWNHRVRKRTVEGEDIFDIVEAYYDTPEDAEKGNPSGWTENGVAPQGSTLEELKVEISRMMEALDATVIDEAALENDSSQEVSKVSG